MAKRIRAHFRTTKHAAALLGSEIRQARVARRYTVRELAERAGITTSTLHKVETGDPTVALGIAFDVAALVGVPLFYQDPSRLASEARRSQDRATLLGQRVRPPNDEIDDDF